MSSPAGTVSNDKSILAANRVRSFTRGVPVRTGPVSVLLLIATAVVTWNASRDAGK